MMISSDSLDRLQVLSRIREVDAFELMIEGMHGMSRNHFS